MTVTEIVKGRFHTMISDATGTTNICTELTNALANSNINPASVIEFDVSSKIVIFGI